LSTFRRRGRIDRSRLSNKRTDSTPEEWVDTLEDGVDYEVEELHEKPRPRGKGIYLLPNAFTTAALFSGFFAIVNAMNDQFQVAAIAHQLEIKRDRALKQEYAAGHEKTAEQKQK
jgi:CDP-diacylglycerol--serine O-phosphatidyltransferase